LFDSIEEKMYTAITGIMVEYNSSEDRCKAVIFYLFGVTESNPEFMDYMLYAKHREFLPIEKPVCSSRPFSLMKEIVASGIATGEIRKIDVNVAVTSLFGGPIRLVFLKLDGVLEQSLSDYLSDSWECSWRSVAARDLNEPI